MPKILDNPRQIILSCAKEILLNQGYKGLNMRAISQKSGIAVGTLYNYFPDKRDITIQLLEDYWLGFLNVLERVQLEDTSIYEKLREIYEELCLFVKTFKEVWLKNYTEGYTTDQMIRKKSVTERFNSKLEEILVKAKEKENINLFMEPYLISKFIIQNFIMMSQMNDFDYNDFEKVVKKLLQ
ncbi:TetR/AcrR family transcriptional regulator [Clostridium sp. 19966]|uniref:TetR/AcrR family transcriptional regulator n=1 Tax=Clostridium sp. 19966 TaxID=2768166 RepID=UPI0028E0077E|nr:TetR/AcrR family transcriptional regulator [Clostridium sp. 19966]MDT8717087.1 TetR/AcrR family transcriptional regulator [Clostridium sp. 19966]